MTDAEPRVFVVDDDDAVRASLSRLLKANGYRVDAFASGPEFLASAAPGAGPACVVLDVRMPEQDGLALQRELLKFDTPPALVFITGHGDIPMSVQAMKAGAVNFLTKPVDRSLLLTAVAEALARSLQARAESSELRELQRRAATLTPREREVMAWVACGRLNKQIADELGTAEKTVKIHRGRVMEKMHARSLAELVRAADKLGIRPIP